MVESPILPQDAVALERPWHRDPRGKTQAVAAIRATAGAASGSAAVQSIRRSGALGGQVTMRSDTSHSLFCETDVITEMTS